MTVYLIDGYNVLHEWLERRDPGGRDRAGRGRSARTAKTPTSEPSRSGARTSEPLRSGARTSEPAAMLSGGEAYMEEERHRLIDRIASYMGGTSDRAIVVFDSHSQSLQKTESATANVEVYFGSFSRSADSVIEREVYALSAGESVVVVSSDSQLQRTIFLPNVVRRSSRQFVVDLHEFTKRIANSQNCIIMSHRVEDRIDPGVVDRLKALRDELAGGSEASEEPQTGSDA